MIASVATFSLDQARKYLGRGYHHGHSHALGQRRAWVGFDTDDNDQSPLRYTPDCGERGLVIRCHDWDEDGRHSPAHTAGLALRAGLAVVHTVITGTRIQEGSDEG